MTSEISDDKRMELLFYYLNKSGKLISYEDALDPYMGTEYEGTPLRLLLPLIDCYMVCDADRKDTAKFAIKELADTLKLPIHVYSNREKMAIQLRGEDIDILVERMWDKEIPLYCILKKDKT